MINSVLSDLFFNHEHPNFDAYVRGMDDPTAEWDDGLAYQAALSDASEFLSRYGSILTTNAGPSKLARDFIGRL